MPGITGLPPQFLDTHRLDTYVAARDLNTNPCVDTGNSLPLSNIHTPLFVKGLNSPVLNKMCPVLTEGFKACFVVLCGMVVRRLEAPAML